MVIYTYIHTHTHTCICSIPFPKKACVVPNTNPQIPRWIEMAESWPGQSAHPLVVPHVGIMWSTQLLLQASQNQHLVCSKISGGRSHRDIPVWSLEVLFDNITVDLQRVTTRISEWCRSSKSWQNWVFPQHIRASQAGLLSLWKFTWIFPYLQSIPWMSSG